MSQRPVNNNSRPEVQSGRNETSGNYAPKNQKGGMDNTFKALIIIVVAIIVAAFVVLIASGAFGGKTAENGDTANVTETEETKKSDSEETTKKEKETETTKKKSDARTIYLTFDYSPSSITEDLLDALDENDVKATFFVAYNDENAGVLKDIADRGHALGVLRTADSDEEVYADLESFKNDINTCKQYIYQNSGVLTDLYRFPGSSQNAANTIGLNECREYLDEIGMKYFDWNVHAYDDSEPTPSADEITAEVLGQISSLDAKNFIVLLHDTKDNASTVEALERIITTLRTDGYEFDKLTESSDNVDMVTSQSADEYEEEEIEYEDSYGDVYEEDIYYEEDPYYEEPVYEEIYDQEYSEETYEDTEEGTYEETYYEETYYEETINDDAINYDEGN